MANDVAVVADEAARIELIKRTVAKGATDDELQLFLMVSKRAGLDPFAGQIRFVKRKVWNSETRVYEEVGTIQTGIDGYRLIASRTKDLAGIDDAVLVDGPGRPEKAAVTVFRFVHGERCPFTASARWSEYAAVGKEGKPIAQWAKMPYLMLSKCAEALALRKAFPQDLSGIYTDVEMQQAEPVEDERVAKLHGWATAKGIEIDYQSVAALTGPALTSLSKAAKAGGKNGFVAEAQRLCILSSPELPGETIDGETGEVAFPADPVLAITKEGDSE